MTIIKCLECGGTGESNVCSECGGLAAFYYVGEDIEANCPECDRKLGPESAVTRNYDIIRAGCDFCHGTGRQEVSDDFADGLGFMED